MFLAEFNMHRDFNREKQGFCVGCFGCAKPCENKLCDDIVKSSLGCYSVDREGCEISHRIFGGLFYALAAQRIENRSSYFIVE